MNNTIYIYKHKGQKFHTGDYVFCKNPHNKKLPASIEGNIVNRWCDFYCFGQTNEGGKKRKIRLSDYKDIVMLASILDVATIERFPEPIHMPRFKTPKFSWPEFVF